MGCWSCLTGKQQWSSPIQSLNSKAVISQNISKQLDFEQGLRGGWNCLAEQQQLARQHGDASFPPAMILMMMMIRLMMMIMLMPMIMMLVVVIMVIPKKGFYDEWWCWQFWWLSWSDFVSEMVISIAMVALAMISMESADGNYGFYINMLAMLVIIISMETDHFQVELTTTRRHLHNHD